MRSAELVIDYSNTDKPFKLIERVSGLGGTEYYDICRLSYDQVTLLADEGIGWLYGKPDWTEFFKVLKIKTLESEKKSIEKKLEALNAKD